MKKCTLNPSPPNCDYRDCENCQWWKEEVNKEKNKCQGVAIITMVFVMLILAITYIKFIYGKPKETVRIESISKLDSISYTVLYQNGDSKIVRRNK